MEKREGCSYIYRKLDMADGRNQREFAEGASQNSGYTVTSTIQSNRLDENESSINPQRQFLLSKMGYYITSRVVTSLYSASHLSPNKQAPFSFPLSIPITSTYKSRATTPKRPAASPAPTTLTLLAAPVKGVISSPGWPGPAVPVGAGGAGGTTVALPGMG